MVGIFFWLILKAQKLVVGNTLAFLLGKSLSFNGHTHDYSPTTHNHDTLYSKTNHTHTGYASTGHKHAAGDITSGTLGVARGGTGVTSYDALKSALGINGTLYLERGSYTGASDASGRIGKEWKTSITCTHVPAIIFIGAYQYFTSGEMAAFAALVNYSTIFDDSRGSDNICGSGLGVINGSSRSNMGFFTYLATVSGNKLSFWHNDTITGSSGDGPQASFNHSSYKYLWTAITM